MNKFFGHLSTICKHKYWVFHYCRRAGIIWQGITHDLSKFSPVEFWEGVKYWQGNRSPIDACKEVNGYSTAWMHHKGRNRHHVSYWVDDLLHGGRAIEMPGKYFVEMICDYLGAGKAYLGKNFTYKKELEWWENRQTDQMLMSHTDRTLLTFIFKTFIEDEKTAFVMLREIKNKKKAK